MVRVDVRLVTGTELPATDPDMPLLVRALEAAGAHVDIRGWRDPEVDWAGATVTLLRSPWDYADHLEEFLAWGALVDDVSALWNPFELVRWNTHKSYLLDLAARGAPVVPTVLLLAGSAASLDGIADAEGWNTVVVKPAVDVGGRGALRFDVGNPAGQRHLDELLGRGDALVQLFAAAIATDGEISVVFIDGVVTHAVRKLPVAGDFRVHTEYGGREEIVPVREGIRELAERVHAVLPIAPLYARVDLVAIAGLWHVMEVEVTEPYLWLGDPSTDALERLVAAVMARVAA